MTELSEDYLWDKSGRPDPEIEHLEICLSSFRLQPSEFAWNQKTVSDRSRNDASNWPSLGKRIWLPAVLTAAVLAVVTASLTVYARFHWRPGEPWNVNALSGSPQLDGSHIGNHADLSVGQILVTDANASARIRVANLGVVDVEPNSRVRLITTNGKRHRIALDFGTISAHMWAPPFSLAIDTPSATLFDLGCAFTLHVEQNGRGMVNVTSGWVEFQTASRNVVVPAGAEAITRPELGPGTPYFSNAAPAFKAAVAEFDSYPDDQSIRATALQFIVEGARARDALTLLSLLNQVSRPQRALVLDRLASFVPIPATYTREDVLDLQEDALGAYWDALRLGNPKSWIMNWKDALAY
jgi:hypothetical protein